MITNDGWLDWAIRMPGKAEGRVNPGINPVKGIFFHSADGWAGTLLDPNSEWGYNKGFSWHLTNCEDGRLVQHFPFTARCHHATAANNDYVGMENEGIKTPLNEAQIQNSVRVIKDLSDWKGWKPLRPTSDSDTTHTLWEHREVTRIGGTPSLCPSGRIPWAEIMSRLKESDEMYIPHVAVAGWFEGRKFDAPTPAGHYWTMQTLTDFQLPEQARGKDVQIAVYMDGGILKYFHGSTDKEAGSAGELGTNYVQMRAKMDNKGTLNFRAETPCNIVRVMCLGYYD